MMSMVILLLIVGTMLMFVSAKCEGNKSCRRAKQKFRSRRNCGTRKENLFANFVGKVMLNARKFDIRQSPKMKIQRSAVEFHVSPLSDAHLRISHLERYAA